ncbi:MAG: cellulase family glycosylhydrolase, partial [Actinomycetota bacterium]|nr:cellulase family glycosylhydrolase [Actinomycetota bacterium]
MARKKSGQQVQGRLKWQLPAPPCLVSALWCLALVVAGFALPHQALAADAPDPGGDENTELSGAPAGKELGFSGTLHIGELAPAMVATLTKKAGGNAARTPISWAGLEPTRDKYNETGFGNYAKLYDALLAEEIRPIFTISFAPVWARDPGAPQDCGTSASCHYPPARSMLGEWQQFVTEVTRRFPRATIEIWNEPNFLNQWQSGVDPARYAELLAAAYDAVKGVNPQGKVFAGGLGGSLKPDSLSAADFLDQAYAASPSLKSHTDAINFHYYPGSRLGAGTPFAQFFAGIRAVRTKYDDEQTPLYVTETGATTTGGLALNEDEQKDLVMRATRKMLTMSDVSGVLVNTLAEPSNVSADDPERGFGVVRATEGLLGTTIEPKLAYCALTRAAGELNLDCPPETVLNSTPPALGNSADVEFAFSSPDLGVTFQCSLDGAPFELCVSLNRYTGLSEGAHTFEVRAMDLLGRVDPYPDRYAFRIDLTAPTTDLSGPTGSTKDTRPQYTATSNDPNATFECSLDGGAFSSCNSTFSFFLTEGPHTISARAVDRAGNRDATPASISITVDNTLPDTTITSRPSAFTSSNQPSFSVTSSEADATFECALDSFDYQPRASPYQPQSLNDGYHVFRVRSRDQAGNVDSSPAFAEFTVDTRSPAAQFTSAPGQFTRDSTPTFYFTADESSTTFA